MNYYWDSLDCVEINGEKVDKWTVFFLKKLNTIPWWTWNVIHSILASYFLELKKDKTFTIEKYEEMWLDKLIEAKIKIPYFLSAQRDYTKWYNASVDKDLEKKNGIIWLVEHYYKEIPEDQHDKYVAIIIDNIKNSLFNFSKSQIYQEIMKNYDKYEIYTEPPKKDFDAMKFRSDWVADWNVDLFVQPDFYLKEKWENKYIIVDWKTWDISSRDGALPEQLLAEWYRIYTDNNCDENIKIEWFYGNLDNNWVLSSWDKIWIESFKSYEAEINRQIEKLSENLVDNDVVSNNPVSIDKFPETEDCKKCETCAFRCICKKKTHE